MSTVAFLFPGQGSQAVGMGAELLEGGGRLGDYFARAEAAAGLPVRRICLDGPAETLTRTEVAQPALFCVSLAAAEAARERGLEPALAAGHSLGEYTAACAAGALAVEDAIELVCLRGRLMAEIGDDQPGAMAAVIGLDAAEVERLCAEADGLVVPANVNSPTQIVVSGDEDAVERVVQAAEAAGARRAVRLQVAAAFHTERMAPVQERMAEAAGAVDWQDPSFPLASNARGGLVDDALSLRAALVQQITSSVRWVECVEALASAGAERYVELGPGRVLSGLVRQIIRGAETSSAGSPAELEALGSASDAGRP